MSRVRLEEAKDGKSYICPACGNGSGETGSGIRPRDNSEGQVKWKCHHAGCEIDFSNFDLAAAHYGLGNCNKAEQAKRLEEIFGLADETFSFSKGISSARQSAMKRSVANMDAIKANVSSEPTPAASTNEPKSYAKLYGYCRQNYPLDNFLAGRGGKWRGLTAETLKRAGALYHGEYLFGEGDKRPAVILPYDDGHYFAREVDGKEKRHNGEGAGLYEALPILNEPDRYNVIVEGEIDALSIAQLFHGRNCFGCVATGSAANWRKVVPELEKKFGNNEDKPKFIVIFDNDDGIESSGKLVEKLKSAGYPAVSFFFQGGKAGDKHIVENSNGEIVEECVIPKVDANDLLQRDEGELVRLLYDAAGDHEKVLKEQARDFAEQRTRDLELEARQVQAQEQIRRAEENRSGYYEFAGDEYFAEQFLLDVALTAKYSSRRTGFANLDGTDDFEREGQKQIFMPGMYLLGATPGAGKTTFAWQLLNQLADAGERCIFCSYEMSRTELFSKSVARELFNRHRSGQSVMELSAADIRRGGATSEDVRQVVRDFSSSKAMKNLRVRELSNVNVVQLIGSLKPLCDDVDKPPVIAIDYLQIIPPTNGKATAKEKVDEIMLRLKDFQRETNSTVILISAFNRESTKTDESPALQAFRESSAIEYSCDVAWLMYTKGGANVMKKNPRPVHFSCKKNRNGAMYEVYFNYRCANDCFVPCFEQDLGDADA